MLVLAPVRQSDKFGSGVFGAPRGEQSHKGVDFAAYPGSSVISLTSGVVSKLGYPYKGDFNLRYVEVKTPEGYRLRYFYIKPLVKQGDAVTEQSVLGSVQSLQYKYSGITDHVHFEIIYNNQYIDPSEYYLRRLEESEHVS